MGVCASKLLSHPWREMPTTCEDDEDFVKSYQPRNGETNHLRILLHGPVCAGKSSFINSVDSVIQGRITGRALTDTRSGNSFTRKYKPFKIQKDAENYCSFIFIDTMGFKSSVDGGVHVEDIKLALGGHVKDDYEFKPERQLKEEDEGYNSSPALADRIHVLVSVVPVNSVSSLSEDDMKKLRKVRLAASDVGIPQLAILTKVDEACPKVKNNIKNAYKSKHVRQQVEKFSELHGIPLNCISLVKNYSSEVSMDGGINVLILSALRQMITLGEDFLNNQ